MDILSVELRPFLCQTLPKYSHFTILLGQKNARNSQNDRVK